MKSNKSAVQQQLSNQVASQRLSLPKIQLFHQKENPIISIPYSKHGKRSLFPSFHPDKVLQLTDKDKFQPLSQRFGKQKKQEEKYIYESKVVYKQKEDQGTEPLSQSSFRQKNNTNQSNLILNSSQISNLNNKSIDYFLHRNQMSFDVAEQIRKLNNEVLSNSMLGEPKHNLSQGRLLGLNNSTHQSNSNIYFQNDFENNLYNVKGSYTKQRYSTSTNSIQKENNSSALSKKLQMVDNVQSQGESMIMNKKMQHSNSNILEVNDKISNNILPSEVKLQSQNSLNIFRLTDNNNDKNLTEHQSNLLRALNMCNPSKLDYLVKQNQNRIKEQKEHILNLRKYQLEEYKQPSTFNKYFDETEKEGQNSQKKQLNNKSENQSSQKLSNVAIIQSEKEVDKQISESNISSFKNRNSENDEDFGFYNSYKQQFKLNLMANEMEEQSKFLKQQQNQINYKLFYSHFDDTYQDIMELLSSNEQPQNDDQTQEKQVEKEKRPRFKQVSAIKTEFLYNIKQMLRMQKLREEKIYKEEIKPNEIMEYIKKRNQIEIILENSKKIKNLREVADLIEKQIGIQNDKITNLLKVLIKKFGLEEYQQQYEASNEQNK